MLDGLKDWARGLKRDIAAVRRAIADPRVPMSARIIGAVTIAYALSPIDLIPDFVPVLGYLDDLILVPAGLWLAISLIPADVLDEHRAAVDAAGRGPRPAGAWAAAAVIIGFWLMCAALAVQWLL